MKYPVALAVQFGAPKLLRFHFGWLRMPGHQLDATSAP